MKLILLDNRFFKEEHIIQWGNIKSKDEYSITLCDFPVADCSMVKVIDLDKESNDYKNN